MDDDNNDNSVLDAQTGAEDSSTNTGQDSAAPESLDQVDLGEESTGESQVEPLEEDNDTPAENSGDTGEETDSEEGLGDNTSETSESDEEQS